LNQTNFEKLRVYQLAELLSDRVWKIVIKWDFCAKITRCKVQSTKYKAQIKKYKARNA